jgi:hypothetical protein
MSTPAQLISKAQRQTYSNTSSYPNTDALLDLNNRLQILYSRIQTEVDEGYFWNYATANTVVSQAEYVTDVVGSLKINQVDGISVKYKSTDAGYTKLKPVAFESLDFDMAEYATFTGEPFYFMKDQSIFIFPSPTEAVTSGFKIFSINQPADVTYAGVEADIKLQPRWHQIAVYGMCADYWYANGKEDKGNLWESKFTTAGDTMIKSMKNREQESLEYVVSTNKFA